MEPKAGRASRRRERLRSRRPVAPHPHHEGRADRRSRPSRSVPRDGRSGPAGLRPRISGGGTPRAIARIEVDVRDWQRCVVGKVLQSPEITLDPGAGAGRIAIKLIAGVRSGRLLPAPSWSDGGGPPSRTARSSRAGHLIETLRRPVRQWKTWHVQIHVQKSTDDAPDAPQTSIPAWADVRISPSASTSR